MKKLSTILILLVVFFAGIFIIIERRNAATITLLSPNGGETLETGSIWTINWETKNIPEGNKIAISIRHLSPENTTTEGQEFDSLIFVDLENNGVIDWAIPSNYPEGEYLMEVTSYESLPINSSTNDESDATFKIINSTNNLESWQTYQNEKFGYRLKYPNILTLREFSETGTGTDFMSEGEDSVNCITVSARTAAKSKTDLAFAEYVKEAAIQEIQGVTKLNSIETINTDSGVVYKTTWDYTPLGQTSIDYLAIAYLEGPGNVYNDNYKTIQLILNDSRCEDVYNQMILTLNK